MTNLPRPFRTFGCLFYFENYDGLGYSSFLVLRPDFHFRARTVQVLWSLSTQVEGCVAFSCTLRRSCIKQKQTNSLHNAFQCDGIHIIDMIVIIFINTNIDKKLQCMQCHHFTQNPDVYYSFSWCYMLSMCIFLLNIGKNRYHCLVWGSILGNWRTRQPRGLISPQLL